MKALKIFLIIIIALIVGFILGFVSFTKQGNFTKYQIQQIIHDYLVKNPKVLVEASVALHTQQVTAAHAQTTKLIEQHSKEIFDTKNKPAAGNLNNSIIIAEFFDYQCPHCTIMGPIIDQLLDKNDDIKVVFMQWPIFGPDSEFAAKAAIAAMQQNQFYQFHKVLIQQGYPLTKDKVLKIAKDTGLNIDQLQKDIDSEKVKDVLQSVSDLAKNLKLMGTPAFIIANTKTNTFRYLDGQIAQEELQKNIDAVR